MATFKKEPPGIEAAALTIKEMVERTIKAKIKVSAKHDANQRAIVYSVDLGEKSFLNGSIPDDAWNSEGGGWGDVQKAIDEKLT